MPTRMPRLPAMRPLLAAAALVLGLGGLAASRMATAGDTANYPAASLSAPTDQAALIERGKYLATAADCAPCHTGPGHAPYAGGLVLATPFGGLAPPTSRRTRQPASATGRTSNSTKPCMTA